MNNKIKDLISIMNGNKKQFLELFVFDFLSILFATIFFLVSVKFIYFVANYYNISFNISINLKNIIYLFTLIWFFIAVIITIIFHFKTIRMINKNGSGLLVKDEE